VDDDPEARQLLERVLSYSKAAVTVVSTAQDALKAVEQLRPHVLICDIEMPGEDGYSLIRRVRALEPERGGNTPAAALTAYTRGEDRTSALRAGFQFHISKPVEISELLAVVANLAGRTGASQTMRQQKALPTLEKGKNRQRYVCKNWPTKRISHSGNLRARGHKTNRV